MSSDWQNEVNICFKNRNEKLNEEKKRNTVSLFGVHSIHLEELENVICLLLFSLERYQRLRWLPGKNCRVGKPRMLIQTSEDSSVSFIVICVFYQYLSVTSLDLVVMKGKILSPLLNTNTSKVLGIFSILLPLKIHHNLQSWTLYTIPDRLLLELCIHLSVYYWKNTKKLGCNQRKETTMVGHVMCNGGVLVLMMYFFNLSEMLF